MKRNLLLLASLFMSISAFAQWEKPVAKGAAEMWFSTDAVITDTDTVPGDTVVYYLYNKEADAFFTEGNDWGTRASWTTEPCGLKVFFKKYLVDGEWDGKTILIFDYSIAKNGWKQLFIDNELACYVDLGAQANYYWEVMAGTGTNTFRFFGADLNPTFNHASYPGYFGIDKSVDDTILYPFLNTEEEGVEGYYLVDWMLIPENDDFVQQMDVYVAAQKLKAAIDEISNLPEADDIKADIEKAIAVYKETGSTKEQLLNAISALQLALNYASIKGATEDSPKDATGFFKNPDFSAGNVDGWDCSFVKGTNVTNLGYQSANYTNGEVTINGFIEAWANSAFNPDFGKRALGDGQLSQTLPSLPAGLYKFSCDAIAVTQDDVSTPCEGAYLFAESGDLSWKTSIHTGDGKPEHFEFVFTSAGNDVTLGLKTISTTANWIAADNFTLVYYGESDKDPQQLILENYIKTCEETYPNPEETYAEAGVRENYLSVMEEAKGATEDFEGALQALQTAFASFDESAKAYATYVAKIQEFQADMASHDYTAEEAALLSDYLMDENEMKPDEDFPNGSYWYIVSNGTLDAAGIAAEQLWLEKLYQNMVANSLVPGQDCTNLLINPKFTDAGGKGWTWDMTTGKTLDTFSKTGGLAEFPCAEVYAGWGAAVGDFTWDVWQEVKAPDGIYQLDLNGFYRVGDNGSFTGEEEVFAELYMNDFATPVQNIAGSQTNMTETAAHDTDAQITNWEGYTGYIPNSMDGASTAFQTDRYKQTVYGLVEGGQMRIGIRKTVATNLMRSWCLWTNFVLTYVGKDEDALRQLVPEYTAKAEALLDSKMSNDALAQLQAAIKQAGEAVSVNQLYDALVALNGGIKGAKSSVLSYENLAAATTSLGEAIEQYQETADEEAVNKASELFTEMDDAYATGEWDDETIAAKIANVDAVINALMLPGNYKDATEDNPVDFSALIVNGTFDEIGDFHGWEGTAFGAGGTTSTCAEHYEKTYDTYQDIKGLPAGYYLAKVQGFYRRGSSDNDYAIYMSENPDSALNAFLYTTSFSQYGLAVTDSTTIQPIADGAIESGLGGATAQFGSDKVVPNTMESAVYWFDEGYYSEPSVIAEVSEGGILRIGVKKTVTISADWSIFDNFQLFYLGTEAPVAIDAIEEAAPVFTEGIFNLAGQRINSLQKGINIVGGKKVFVK